MPRLLLICLIATLSSSLVFAQRKVPGDSRTIFQLDSLPSKGVLLNKSWKWHVGDNPIWGRLEVDDSQWDSIQPAYTIANKHSARFQQAPMGWFRLVFMVDSSLARTPVALRIDQVGASELYLDDSLLYRLGTVGRDYAHEVSYTPASWERYLLPQLSPGRHVLAVRLSQQRPPWYTPAQNYYYDSIFSAELVPSIGLTAKIARGMFVETLTNYLTIGLFLMLSAIHFLYYGYRRVRINIIFGLMTLFAAGSFIVDSLVGVVTDSALVGWVRFGGSVSSTLFFIFLLATFYAFLSRRFSLFFWIISPTLLLLIVLTSFLVNTQVSNALLLLTVLVAISLLADGLRVSIAALRTRRAEAKLVLTSLSIVTLILVIGLATALLPAPSINAYYSGQVADLLFFVTIVFTIAVILARDYAQTNRNLEDRLAEVEQLSVEKEVILKEQNQTLERQVSERTTELSQSLDHLRNTQTQLIQKEKMASLGELTAGIAHEIQNPLNFVNNFAEVSVEMVNELQEEFGRPSIDATYIGEILTDLSQNQQRVVHHGNRAASIVKGMLEHSRSATGERQATDLNALTDEYLRLAYQGMRAKDQTFSCALVTDFALDLGQMNIVPQDMGRVLLNLFNNAFYAVKEQGGQCNAQGKMYQPTVSVRTQRTTTGVQIRLIDNGIGMAPGVQQKIFQPFFTTKPAGEGTGLGLSLSYDIVTRGHGGSLLVESQPGEGTEFIIQLPTVSGNPLA